MEGQTFRLMAGTNYASDYAIRLPGAHQIRNAAVAIVAAKIVSKQDPRITEEHLHQGAAHTQWPGRLEKIRTAPDVILEIRYYSTYNFIGDRVDGYEEPIALLTREAAAALKAVSGDLMEKGFRLKIYDAYRPQRAVAHFVRWSKDKSDTRMKQYFYPDLDKSVLFAQGYIAERSGHSRGSTVDLTLFDMKSGKEVDMGGTFDWFGKESHPDWRGVTDTQFANRMLLREIMTAHGF